MGSSLVASALGGGGGMTLAALDGCFSAAGLSITREDAMMLVQRRAESLAEVERVEFGVPAMVAIGEAVATSPFLVRGGVAETLAELQDVFYALRDELPVDVPDDEIVEALRGSFDAFEGDAAQLAALPAEEVMAFAEESRVSFAGAERGEYRIVDDEGRAYVFKPSEWDYDEAADGWDGERWSDDFDSR